MLYVAQNITNDQCHFLPSEVCEVFRAILNRESH
jgi:hypothetical protein